MAVRLLGTVGFVTRTNASYKSCLLRCCCINYEKINPLQRQHYPSFNLYRNFSYDTLEYCSKYIFRTVAESEVCYLTRDLLTYVHDVTSIPWWCTILVSAVTVKSLTTPFWIYQKRLLGKLIEVNKMEGVGNKVHSLIIKKQKENLWSPSRAKKEFLIQMKKERRQLIEKHNCHPLRIILLGYVDLPVWICLSIAWRTMSYGFSDSVTSSKLLIKKMMVEGPFWCTNLTLPDPTYILPALVLMLQFLNVELRVIETILLKKDKSWSVVLLTNLSRLLGVIGAVFSCYLPSSVGLFWLSSLGITLVRDFTFMSPKVRQFLNLPNLPFNQNDVLLTFRDRLLKLIRLKVTGKIVLLD